MTTEENKIEDIEKIKKQAEEYLNGWKRAKADYLNLKKDMEAQGKEIKEWMSKIFLLPLLEIMDSFDRAGTLDAGIEGIKKQFEDFLKANRVEEMSAKGGSQPKADQPLAGAKNSGGKTIGEKFDPLKHEAMESVSGGEPGMIAEETQKGYLVGGEVLRPAKVKVYK